MYSKVEIWNGPPGQDGSTKIAEYTNVSDYTEHSNYVSFTSGGEHHTVPTGDVWIRCIE